MRRRDFLKNIGLGAVAITVGQGLLKGKSARRPNFIYILADDLGYG
jgi:anaerobic selenocysteine-containing dehydrogenase